MGNKSNKCPNQPPDGHAWSPHVCITCEQKGNCSLFAEVYTVRDGPSMTLQVTIFPSWQVPLLTSVAKKGVRRKKPGQADRDQAPEINWK